MTWVDENWDYEEALAHIDEQIKLGDRFAEQARYTHQVLRKPLSPIRSPEPVVRDGFNWAEVRDGSIDYE